MRRENSIDLGGFAPLNIKIAYDEIDESPDIEHEGPHIHDKCEVYINVEGDVSFFVEKNIYPVKSGDVIITKPYEYHHCVYHSKSTHKYFCLWIEAEDEDYLNMFFGRDAGQHNRITLSDESRAELTDICFRLINDEIKEKYYYYFKILHLLSSGSSDDAEEGYIPSDILLAVEFIDRNYLSEITVPDIAKYAHVSVNTLERHFKNSLKTTPMSYVNKKRILTSATLLKEGYSVLEACEMSGFSDYSGYIAKFKKIFGMTPLKYKKMQK